MKILHTADIHLGVKYSKLSKEKQLLLRDESIFNIRKLFDIAKTEGYDVVLICGDLFHFKSVASSISKAFFDAVKGFLGPVIYISGNHDESFILPLQLPENFIVLDNVNTSYQYQGVTFHNKYYQDFDKLQTNILLLHGNIENTSDVDYFEINNYLNQGFDYIALGHVHQYKQFRTGNNIYAYSGSLFSSGFDESGEKGFIKLEIKDQSVKTLQFCPFAARKFIVCLSDISGLITNSEIIEKIEEDLKEIKAKKQDIVRVVLKGALNEENERSVPLILNKFSDYFYFEIQDKTTLKIDIDKIKKEKLSFKYEFISLVEESQLDDDSKRIICEIGLEALKGEDINI